MKVFKIFWITVATLIVIGTAVYAYYGGFATIEVKVEETGGEVIVYESAMGAYSQTGEIMDNIYQQLQIDEIETNKGIGIYYDDASVVEKSRLRFEVGEVLEGVSEKQLKKMRGRYKIKALPKGKYVVVEFPYKGFGSIVVGIMRVYPAIKAYLKENEIETSHPSQEIYDLQAEKTIYRIMI